MSEQAAASSSDRQPLGELNTTQLQIMFILQSNQDQLKPNEISLLHYYEQCFQQYDQGRYLELQAAETTVSTAANSILSNDLSNGQTMKPFPFLPSNNSHNLMAQASNEDPAPSEDDPSTSNNMGSYLEREDSLIVAAAESRQTPPIKSGEIPSSFSLLSPLQVPITVTAYEVLTKCQQRISNPAVYTQIFEEVCPPPCPEVIPENERPSIDQLRLKTPLIHVKQPPSDAYSIEIQNFCYKSSIAVIRGLTNALKMDLSLFSTKSILETQPGHSVEVRTQYGLPGDTNVDETGQPTWKCASQRSRTTIEGYGAYQAESFIHCLKEEIEKLFAAGTASTIATATADAQAVGTSNGTAATKAPVSSLLSLFSSSSDTRESSSTRSSSCGPPPAKRRRRTGNQASTAKFAATAKLCGTDDLPKGHIPKKIVKFGTNVDLSDATKFPSQLAELNKMPAFSRNSATNNLLSQLGYSVLGMNTVQLYMKVPGCRTPGHLENNCFASVNINIGPGECEWFATDYEYWPVIDKMCKDRKLDLMKDAWWPNFEDLIKARVPVYRFNQKAGDVVWVGGGSVHWVQSTGWCNNVAWNVGPMTAEQIEMSLYAYEWNKLTNYRSLVPMQHLCWQLALNIKLTNRKMYDVVKGVLIKSLAFCRMISDYIGSRTKKQIQYQPRIEGEEASHYCYNCEIEVFNMLFAKKLHTKFRVFCVNCAKKTKFEEYDVLQQTSFEELCSIFDGFQLHTAETALLN